jgi:ribosomal protein S27E
MRRFELRSECPDCGAHSTIARLSGSAVLTCSSCGAGMLRPI